MGTAILNGLGFPDRELSISLVSDRAITRLNQEYLNRSGATDVIAFPMQEGAFSEINPHLLGDVVISVERAIQQSRSKGHSLEEEVCLLLIHGTLHLLGYDHETPGPQARAMRKREKQLLLLIREQFTPSRLL